MPDASIARRIANLGNTSRTISLADFGVLPTASAVDNLAKLKEAIAAAPEGSVLVLPDGIHTFDTGSGLSNAADFNKRLTLHLIGDMKASTTSAIQANPSFILKVSGDGVTFTGSGRIIGSGTINSTNAGTDETIPGLVQVTGDDFTFDGPEIVDPPKIGLHLYGCYRAKVTGRFTGGPTAYTDTAHFAIRATGGGGHIFEGNRFYPDANGGMCVQCIFTSGSGDNIYKGNYAKWPYEKLIYAYDSDSVCIGNIVEGNPDSVPGTNIAGSITAPIRFHGSDNLVQGNRVTRCAGGAQMMDGDGNNVIDNMFLDCGQSAISIYQSTLSRTTVRGNTCTAGALPGFTMGDGIRIVATGGPSTALAIENNTVTGFSTADPIANIALRTNNTAYGLHSIVKPTVGNGRYYVVTTAGTTGGSEPVWNTTPSGTTTDGTVTWTTYAYEGGQADIRVIGGGSGMAIQYSSISNNICLNGARSISIDWVHYSRIANNLTNSTTAITEANGAYNRFDMNHEMSSSNNITGLSATSSQTRLTTQPTLADPTGGATVDTEARATIAALIDKLEAGGVLRP